MKPELMRPAVAAALLLLATSGCHRERTPVERGAAAFMRICASCHGLDGRGTHPPGYRTPPANLTSPELQARLSDDLLRETIRYGKGQMPPFGMALSDQEVNDLVAYVRTLDAAKH